MLTANGKGISKMKKLLSKMFFLSNSARGMLFALTLATVGNYLWFSFFHLSALWAGTITPWIACGFCVGAALITLYALILAVAALIGLIKCLWRGRTLRPLGWLIPSAACIALGVIGAIRFFPPIYIYECVIYPYHKHYDPDLWLSGGLPGVPPGCWGALFLLALLLILAGGLMLTMVFSSAEKKKIRSVFGKAVPALWGVFALWHLFTIGLALYESREAAVVVRKLEHRFGRPLTAAGVAALYREQGVIDAGYWKKQKEAQDSLPTANNDGLNKSFCFIELPDRPRAETLAWYGKLCREHRTAIAKLERCFDRVPPQPEKSFVPGKLHESLSVEESNCCRAFSRIERNRLIFALAAGDAGTAWACYSRMRNVCHYLCRELCCSGSWDWVIIENRRLDCVEKLLESRLLPDGKLDELDADLAELERVIPRNHLQAMYIEASVFQDVFMGVAEGITGLADRPRGGNSPGAFAPYRWILPQWWYHAALDKKSLLRAYLAPDLTAVRKNENYLLVMCRTFDEQPSAWRNYYALTARARGMRALIRAEKYRRKHGEFPKTLANLPEDPFTGKPLVYELGKTTISERVWKSVYGDSDNETGTVTVDAVSVRSPAEGLSKFVRDPEKGIDRTRAVIRY